MVAVGFKARWSASFLVLLLSIFNVSFGEELEQNFLALKRITSSFSVIDFFNPVFFLSFFCFVPSALRQQLVGNSCSSSSS